MASLKDVANAAQPNTILDVFRKLGIGSILRALRTQLFAQVPNAAPADMIAAVHTVQLPNDAKARRVSRAYVRAGGVTGELVVDAPPMGAATATGHVNCSISGDITLASADAITSIDVEYEAEKNDLLTLTLPVVPGTGVMALPAGLISQGIQHIVSANALVGTVTGVAAVVANGAVPGTTHQVNMNVAKNQVQFRIADAVSSATVVLAMVPAIDTAALLAGDSGGLI